MRSLFQTREVLTVNAIDKSADQLRGIVYGAAVGDALGVPYEFMKRDSFECAGMTGGGAHGMPAGTFSDDTSLMLATLCQLRRPPSRRRGRHEG